MAPQREQLELDRTEDIFSNGRQNAHINSLSPSISPRTPESPSVYEYPDSSPVTTNHWNEHEMEPTTTTDFDDYDKTMSQKKMFDELKNKLQNVTQQNANVAKGMPSNTGSPQIIISDIEKAKNVKTDIEPKFKPPKLPILNDIHERKQNKQIIHSKHKYNDSEQNVLPSLCNIEHTLDSKPKEVEKANTHNKDADMSIKRFSSTEQQSAYVREKILGDIAKYNENRKIMSTSPNIEGHSENKDKTMENNEPDCYMGSTNKKICEEPITFNQPKLPFLNEICKLKRHDEEFTIQRQEQLKEVSIDSKDNKINTHIGHIENRPKFGALPFLDDIKNIGKMKAKTKERKSENSIQIPEMVSSSITREEESDNVREHMQNTISDCNESREVKLSSPTLNISGKKIDCKINSNDKEHHMANDEIIGSKDSGMQNIKNILTQNTNQKSNTSKSVRFSFEDEQIYSKEVNSSIQKPEKPQENGDTKAIKLRLKKTEKNDIKIDEKTNMSKLADQIIPQLNAMQKNYLGLLFYNELSDNIVEDIVAQKISEMTGTKLETILGNLEQQVCDRMGPILMNCVSEEVRTVLVCDAFGDFKTQEKAAVVFTTGSDAMDVCSNIADFGGRIFKKALIRNIMADEDQEFNDEVVRECIKDQTEIVVGANKSMNYDFIGYVDEQQCQNSEDDESFSSAEESIVDEYVYH